MQLWNDNRLAILTDAEGSDLRIGGGREERAVHPGRWWVHWRDQPDGVRVWRSRAAGVIERPKDLTDDEAFLREHLAGLPAEASHPMLSDGFAAEVKSLLDPRTDPVVVARVDDVVSDLEDEFRLSAAALLDLPQGTVVDGYGPDLIVRIDGELAVLPELLPLFLGPALLNQTQCWVATRLDRMELNVTGKIVFEGSRPDRSSLTEGLV